MTNSTEVTVTHRGFIRKLTPSYPAQVRLPRELELVSDPQVNELYDELNTLGATNRVIDYVEKVIDVFNRLVPEFREFMVRNMIFVGENDYRYKFFLSIERFVLTGNAGMSPFTFLELMGEFPRPATPVNLHAHFKNPFNMEFFNLPQHELISMWLNHTGGLTHMVETLFVLFGDDARTPIKHRLLPRRIMV